MTTFQARSTADRTQRLIRVLTGTLLVALMLVGAAISEHSAAAAAADGTSTLIRVGAGRPIKSIAEAARRAVDGATIEVDAGEYRADVAVWSRNDLRVRAIGGRVRLIADGAAAEGKGIWVVRARGMSVEGFDFQGAAVPSRNGAGIRLETGSLRVFDCSFMYNETGLLTNNDTETELDVENSEFAYNQRPDGHNHNLYVGTIKRLSVTGSYFHHGHSGHLLKSRAALNHITYNRLSDEADGSASYELEFPNGGVAHVIGNIVQQGPLTQNPHLVSYGAEGYRWARNEIDLVHNTLVNDLSESAVYLRVSPGSVAVRIANNLLVGRAGWEIGPDATFQNNVMLTRADIGMTSTDVYRALPARMGEFRALDFGAADGVSLTPDRQYRHPRGTTALRAAPSVPGALQPEQPAPR